jgi:hypothetical protein
MQVIKKNLLTNTEILLQQILDKLDDIYICMEATLEIQEATLRLSSGEDAVAQALAKVKH